ncbi:hypothetical protein MMC19_003328 [Ptychographa xylographoides]|nr:hypothetical protein [Ptychographa xylographoides]
MSFRKRNVGISGPPGRVPGPPLVQASSVSLVPSQPEKPVPVASPASIPGVRPSPLDGRLTTSTGTQSLDNLLAGHAGLALGCSLLLEESGTTDYAGTLLRYYAAEGVVQKHTVHVVGVGDHWGRELPAVVEPGQNRSNNSAKDAETKERMKIAWRYERLGEFGAGSSGSRGGIPPFAYMYLKIDLMSISTSSQTLCLKLTSAASAAADRSPAVPAPGAPPDKSPIEFCHSFDLTKRLALPAPGPINFIPIPHVSLSRSPFLSVIQALSHQMSSSGPNSIHRLIIPTLLSPAFYPVNSSLPEHVLRFLHSIRSLLRQNPNRLTVMISLPLTLYPRSTGLVRWMELLSDGVIELVPFPHSIDIGPSLTTSGAATSQEEKPQGMVKVHRLPIFHERGGGSIGGVGVTDDLAFTVSRRKFVIKPFSLPPVEGDTEAQKGEIEGGKATKIDIDF